MAEAELGLLLLNLVHEIVRIGPFEGTLKKDCTDLTRRISLLSHLCEEIREFKGDLLPSGSSSSQYFSCLEDLVAALKASKNLLLVAFNSDSKILLDDSSKKIAFEFQSVTWQLERALGNLPYNHFDISDEVCEQVELVRAQLRRATERYGPLNSKLLSRTSSQPLHSERHLQKLGSRVISRLRFGNISNLSDDFVQKSNYTTGHNMEQMMQESETTSNFSSSSEAYNLNEFYTTEAEKLANKSSEEIKKPDSIVIPDDFRCPISLEVMRDPVIVSTGQTYERSFIQRWIDCGNKTCPKTQQVLPDLTLTPNYVLRSLITQWCEKHKIDPPMGSVNRRIRKSDGSFHEVCGDRESINALVRKLSSRSVDERRSAATEIRSLSKRSTDNRILIAEAGAIPVLVNLLTTEDVRTQENAVTSILNLSIYENNKGRIMLAGAVPSIVQVLRMGSMEARENSAATLFSLSLLDENKITIGASGAIPDLVELLQNGSSRGKKDAATALFNLCIYQGNKGRAVRAGILVPLTKMLTDSSSSMVDEALTILSVLASHQEGKAAIVKASVIPVLIDLMRMGLPRNKENAAAILLALCKKDAENLACIGRLGAVIPLTELAKSGTERAQRKATSLLEHLRKLQQL